ncbi:MAG: type II toxin-antitoxin system VapC family toxin [Candidatus Atribacteria bacterium]|nr:type II toxin-antitoxin system VapC family toxin [Candidatus Atribacteria bacterium]
MESGIVLDSFAVLAYLQAEKGAQQVKELLHQAANGQLTVLMTVINLGEVYYITSRVYGQERAEEVLAMLKHLPIKLVVVDEKLALEASRIKAKHPLSYADAFAVTLAQRHGIPVVTGDPEFSCIENLVSVKWLK